MPVKRRGQKSNELSEPARKTARLSLAPKGAGAKPVSGVQLPAVVRHVVLRSAEELLDVCGVNSEAVAKQLLAQVVQVLDQPWNEELVPDPVGVALGLLQGLQPKTATEALLAVQMIAVHQAATKFLERASLQGQTFEGVDANVLRAGRLMRVFNEQLEAMAKLKGKSGQQRVVVEHVTVNAGGQAIVGALTTTKASERGGGG